MEARCYFHENKRRNVVCGYTEPKLEETSNAMSKIRRVQNGVLLFRHNETVEKSDEYRRNMGEALGR